MVGMEAAALSAAVSGTLKIVGNKLAPLVIKKYSSVVGVEKDLKELQDLAVRINCWLRTADGKGIGDDPSVNWLKNLEQVAYDVDDVVDEFQLEAEKHETYGDGGILSKCMHKKPKSLMSRWRAANKIKKIKKRFAKIVNQATGFNAIENCLPVGQSVRHKNQTTEEMPSLPIGDAGSVLGRDQDKSKIITKLIEAKDQQESNIVSIIGLGGSGKTTLAKLVFSDDDTIKKLFEVRLWVHVSQECNVLELIKKLFEAITKDKSEHHPLNHMSETISKELTGKRFLLVLDDVWIDDRIQWEQFREQFMAHLKSGAPTSKILLTTRSQRVAEVVESTDLFHLPLLSPDDSWQLFTHRFSAPIRSEFEEVGKEIVKKCGGVPLAIIFLAHVLRDKEHIEQWQAIRYNSLLDAVGEENRIFACLRLSYFHLPSHLKPCFTICSLLPKGYIIDRERLIDQWIAHDMIAVEEGVGYLEYTAHEYFNSLVQMSFLQDVRENFNGRVECRIHDLVHDLARSILGDKISLVVGNEATSSTNGYRYFSLTKQKINLPPKNIFRKARAIYVHEGYHEAKFGKALKKARHLRSITVECNYKTAVPPIAILQIKNLKYLEISAPRCKKIPEDISDIWSLQALHLKCGILVELPKSIGKLQKLRTLNLSRCESLNCLPDSIGDCRIISSIDLSDCNITVLPDSIGRNKNLRVLRLSRTKIERLPSSITTLKNLECMNLLMCTELVELPAGIGNLEKLQVLNLNGCHIKLGGMPVGIGKLNRLQKLELFVVGEGEKSARISELANVGMNTENLTIRVIARVMEPDDAHKACLKQKTNLQRLDLEWITYDAGEVNTELVQGVLDGLEPPSGLKELKIGGYLGKQYARWMQDQVGGRAQGLFHYFPFLRVMKLYDFPNLKHLHRLVELPCLEVLELGKMPSLESISGGPFPSLVKLKMTNLPSLRETWMVAERTMPDGEEGGSCSNCTPHLGQVGVGNCASELVIYDCPRLKVMPYLPSSVQRMYLNGGSEKLLQSPGQCQGYSSSPSFSHLKKLVLWGMTGLGSGRGWELLQHMTVLESLHIRLSSVLTELQEGLRSLTSLRSLHVIQCSAIYRLPEWLGELGSLQKLTIKYCPNLITLPESMGYLTSLQVLEIRSSNLLYQLPNCLGELRSLKKFTIARLPGLTYLPLSICMLTSLEKITIYECPSLRSLPPGIKDLTALRELNIDWCPKLRSRLEKGTGEDWHLISHIPNLFGEIWPEPDDGY